MVDIYLDIERKGNDKDILNIVGIISKNSKVAFSNLTDIPWFPKTLEDLNFMGADLKQGGDQLSSDHPGFNDPVYKKRRTEIEEISRSFKFGGSNVCPDVEYTEEETKVWSLMWDKLNPLHRKHACEGYNKCLDLLIESGVFTRERIPQIRELNDYYYSKNGMFFRPTGGLLSEREFLNSLAFRVFPTTQYIRHSSKPLYTPEPDLIHEFLGHASSFSDRTFCDFSQEIGLASLGAPDDEIARLGAIYWYTVEFGITKENGKVKIYGGGILSSPAEILNAVNPSETCTHLPFDIQKMAIHPIDICNVQTEYFAAPTFIEMVKRVKEYAANIKRPFNVSYNSDTHTIEVDRKLESLI
eukprot:CAMPEP_0170519436 /NCGR_PEP_ID=MMETSP0209-20121228/4852_1 /TAXON_ID=665100 ORGANISM="Litonotus pictus, Strain P1" /NCGR_SAMPLE_ID=MMETSP0209 /ASSEMBLY_ACC=CAM_ASM_000301 /LENGTH=355 /DNA_ID=CAMNT_0010805317 /DNA_START=296 /DNA_END=1363 /DNA_ORIENTATION=-